MVTVPPRFSLNVNFIMLAGVFWGVTVQHDARVRVHIPVDFSGRFFVRSCQFAAGFVGWIALGLVLPAGVAQASQKLVMPYACTVGTGVAPADGLKLRPSQPRAYVISGRREQKPYTACRSQDARNCVTLMVHKFNISCGGRPVAWARVAKVLRATAERKGRFADGEMVLADGSSDQSPPQRSSIQRFVFPPGYAPIGELGARLVLAGAGVKVVAARPANGQASPALFAPGPSSPESWSTTVSSTTTSSTPPLPQAHVPRPELSPLLTGSSGAMMLVIAVLTGAIALGGFASWRLYMERGGGALRGLRAVHAGNNEVPAQFAPLFDRVRAVAERAFRLRLGWPPPWHAAAFVRKRQAAKDPIFEAFKSARDPMVSGGAHTVERVYERARADVACLNAASALRETLNGEIAAIGQRISMSLALSEGDDVDEAVLRRRQSALLRTAARELERIQKIARSAAVGQGAGNGSEGQPHSGGLPRGSDGTLSMPQSVSEAYLVLGVTASVSEIALKKVVDALRMSWHPDHACDDIDRAERDERIKQINLAWDLICADKRDSDPDLACDGAPAHNGATSGVATASRPAETVGQAAL